MTLKIVDFVLTILELGHGHYEEARKHALAVYEADPLYVGSLSLADLVEAAWRSDDPDSAKLALGTAFRTGGREPDTAGPSACSPAAVP